MYVDDGSVLSAGPRHKVYTAIVDASKEVDMIFEDDLELPLARNKGELIASDDALGRALAKGLGKKYGKLKNTVSMLGVDFSAGKKRGKRGKPSRAARMKSASNRTRRLRILRKAGKRLPSVFRTGILPVAAYGCESTGMDDIDLCRIRRMAGTATPPFAKQSSTTIKLLIHEDPANHVNAAPICRWAKEIWLLALRGHEACHRSTTLLTMHRVFEVERNRFGDAPNWAETRGPAGTLFLHMPPHQMANADGVYRQNTS